MTYGLNVFRPNSTALDSSITSQRANLTAAGRASIDSQVAADNVGALSSRAAVYNAFENIATAPGLPTETEVRSWMITGLGANTSTFKATYDFRYTNGYAGKTAYQVAQEVTIRRYDNFNTLSPYPVYQQDNQITTPSLSTQDAYGNNKTILFLGISNGYYWTYDYATAVGLTTNSIYSVGTQFRSNPQFIYCAKNPSIEITIPQINIYTNNLTIPYSFEVWVFPKNRNAKSTLVSSGRYSDTEIRPLHIYLDSTGRIVWENLPMSTNTTTATVPLNAWTLISCVATYKSKKVYINGTLVSEFFRNTGISTGRIRSANYQGTRSYYNWTARANVTLQNPYGFYQLVELIFARREDSYLFKPGDTVNLVYDEPITDRSLSSGLHMSLSQGETYPIVDIDYIQGRIFVNRPLNAYPYTYPYGWPWNGTSIDLAGLGLSSLPFLIKTDRTLASPYRVRSITGNSNFWLKQSGGTAPWAPNLYDKSSYSTINAILGGRCCVVLTGSLAYYGLTEGTVYKIYYNNITSTLTDYVVLCDVSTEVAIRSFNNITEATLNSYPLYIQVVSYTAQGGVADTSPGFAEIGFVGQNLSRYGEERYNQITATWYFEYIYGWHNTKIGRMNGVLEDPFFDGYIGQTRADWNKTPNTAYNNPWPITGYIANNTYSSMLLSYNGSIYEQYLSGVLNNNLNQTSTIPLGRNKPSTITGGLFSSVLGEVFYSGEENYTNITPQNSSNWNFNAGTNFTVEFYIYAINFPKANYYSTDNYAREQILLSYNNGTDESWGIYLGPYSTFITVYKNGVSYLTGGSLSSKYENTWYHIALSCENGVIKLYIDGTVVATNSSFTGFTTYSSGGSLRIGGGPGTSNTGTVHPINSNYFIGWLASLRVVIGKSIYNTTFPKITRKVTISRSSVLGAYAANKLAPLYPDELSVQYWMLNGIATGSPIKVFSTDDITWNQVYNGLVPAYTPFNSTFTSCINRTIKVVQNLVNAPALETSYVVAEPIVNSSIGNVQIAATSQVDTYITILMK